MYWPDAGLRAGAALRVPGRGVNIAPQVEVHGAGWVVPADPDLLAAAIINALRDPESRWAVGQAGRR